jgi:hypothetical protein
LRAFAWALIAALFSVAVLLALALLAPVHTHVVGAAEAQTPDDVVYDPTRRALGLYADETLPDGTRYRWSDGHATFTLPYASQSGEFVAVTVRVAAAWAPGQQPARGTLLINGHDAAAFVAGRDLQDVTAVVDTRRYPNPHIDPAHVQVEIVSDAVPLAGDSRVLGVALERVTLQTRPSLESLLLAVLLCGAAIGAVALSAARLGLRWAITYTFAAITVLAALQWTYTPRAIAPVVEALLAALCFVLAAVFAPRSRPVNGLARVGVLLWLVYASRVLGQWENDDAYISYRYAWNLLHGNGLVYNPGDVVEGYTNFLWTLLAAAAMWAAFPPAGVMLAANISLAMGVVVLAWRVAGRMSRDRYVMPVAVVVLLAVDGALMAYGARGSGMESIAFAFFTLLALVLLWPESETSSRMRAWGGVALALAALTRPEGLLVAAVLLGIRTWHDRNLGLPAGRLLLSAALPMVAFVAPYELWRLTYYGWPFPNTFYAKSGFSMALLERGWDYLRVFAGERWLVSAGAVISLLLAFTTRPSRAGVRHPLAALVVAFSLYVLWAGGDYFPGWRFLVPVLVPLILLGVDGLSAVAARAQHAGLLRPTIAALVAACTLFYGYSALDLQSPQSVLAQETRLHATYVAFWGSAGLWLRDNTPPGTLSAAKGAGAIAYYSERPIIDMYGLNDLHIGHLSVSAMGTGKAGHEKSDPAYVLDQKPMYIFGQWANYFEPIEDRLANEYYLQTARSPTGAMMEWLVRK